mgnify:CR=1 FL=1
MEVSIYSICVCLDKTADAGPMPALGYVHVLISRLLLVSKANRSGTIIMSDTIINHSDLEFE